jgi:hypothetical protein
VPPARHVRRPPDGVPADGTLFPGAGKGGAAGGRRVGHREGGLVHPFGDARGRSLVGRALFSLALLALHIQ